MRISYDVLLGMGEGSPRFHQFAAREGWTVPQAAALAVNSLSKCKTQAHRDHLLSLFGDACEFNIRSEREFGQYVEQMVEHLDPLDTQAQRIHAISEAARQHGPYYSPERLKALHAIASKASLQQAISDRMRASDHRTEAHQPPPLPKHDGARAQGEDSADLRSALLASVATPHADDRRVRFDADAARDVPLRDVLAASFAAHAQRDAEQDPLQDDQLRDMSNAV